MSQYSALIIIFDQHFHQYPIWSQLNIGQAREDCNTLSFTWTSSSPRSWNIQIMQVELGWTWFSWYFIFNMIRSTSITRWKYFSYWLCVFQISCTAAWRPTAGCLQWFTGILLSFNNHDNVNFFVRLDFLLIWSGSDVIFNKGSLKESSQELYT